MVEPQGYPALRRPAGPGEQASGQMRFDIAAVSPGALRLDDADRRGLLRSVCRPRRWPSGLLLGASGCLPRARRRLQHAGAAKPERQGSAGVADQGDASRGIACASRGHGAWQQHHPGEPQPGRATPRIPGQGADRLPGQAGWPSCRCNGPGGNPTPMTAMAQNLTPADMQNIALYLAQQPLKDPATAGHEKLADLGSKRPGAAVCPNAMFPPAACHSRRLCVFQASISRLPGQFPCISKSSLLFQKGRSRQRRDARQSRPDVGCRQDIKAVADYAAGGPAAAPPPATRGRGPAAAHATPSMAEPCFHPEVLSTRG